MISVLIRARNDDRVFSCIASIKKTSPTSIIRVSVMPSKSLENRISKLHIRYCVVPKRNVSMTDCVGYILAKQLGIKFLTGDKEFEHLDNVEFVK